MSLKIYNTATKKKETFIPMSEGKIGMYVCGITAYDSCHIGHARSAVVFDVMTRYLRYRGYDIFYVRNFTDVDDKIITKAKDSGLNYSEIAERYIGEHNEDMDALGIARPDAAPRATQYIQEMIRLIEKLIAKDLAYVVDGDVYYAVENFSDYGKLSGRNLDDMMAGARIDVNENKKNPLDFALWKASKEGEPWWESPWGQGRPGWHIECSVMSQKYLGDTFDIHGGGEDLIFPHHENEIAQSEGATGKTFVRYWIHHGFVRINREKMSKSLKNIMNVRDILKHYHPEIVRFFILQTHYKSPLDFSDEALAEARRGMERFYTALKSIQDALKGSEESQIALNFEDFAPENQDAADNLSQLPDRFVEAMDDDFNTAKAIGHLFDAVRLINSLMADRDYRLTDETAAVLRLAEKTFRDLGEVLGLFLDDPDQYFLSDRNREAEKRDLNVEEIDRLVEERRSARVAKNWQRADEIRDLLAEKQIVLKDTPQSTTWKIE
ncbi:MAG: cysteine--tRNA ligase [Deltaproteobacteria bacterium]|nr:cysteine--tRNA ligase [Deltaproteobacteria bacterium]